MSEQIADSTQSVPKKAGRPRRVPEAIDSEIEAMKAKIAELETKKKLLAKQEEERVRKQKAAALAKDRKEQLAKQETNLSSIVKLLRANKLHHVDVTVWTQKVDAISAALK